MRRPTACGSERVERAAACRVCAREQTGGRVSVAAPTGFGWHQCGLQEPLRRCRPMGTRGFAKNGSRIVSFFFFPLSFFFLVFCAVCAPAAAPSDFTDFLNPFRQCSAVPPVRVIVYNIQARAHARTRAHTYRARRVVHHRSVPTNDIEFACFGVVVIRARDNGHFPRTAAPFPLPSDLSDTRACARSPARPSTFVTTTPLPHVRAPASLPRTSCVRVVCEQSEKHSTEA